MLALMIDGGSPTGDRPGGAPVRDTPAVPAVVCWLAPKEGYAGALERLLVQLPQNARLVAGFRPGTPPVGDGEDGGSRVAPLELPDSATVAHLANRAAELWPAADLVLLFPDALPCDGWLERLRAAAVADSTTAMANALNDAALGLERSPSAAPAGASASGGAALNSAADTVAAASAKLRPRLATVAPTCMYVRREALELLGPFDETYESDLGAAQDLAYRARQRGLANVLGDDVLVTAPDVRLPEADSLRLAVRYPTLEQAAQQPPSAALEHSLTLALAACEPLRVTFDARALGPRVGGTQVYLLELLRALATGGNGLLLRVLVGPDLNPVIRERLLALPGTELLTYEQALERPAASHVVHRPQQIFSAHDLVLLRPLGKRLVITHHDLIAFHNPTYFATAEEWQRYARTTRQALAAADRVIFFSKHALRDCAREELLNETPGTVIHLGADNTELLAGVGESDDPEPPSTAPALAQTPFLLCLGADYRHKNRPFALALQDELRAHHGWPGVLVLAGPHVEHGSSRDEEAAVRRGRSIAPQTALELSAVTDRERRWLMHNAAAIVYPSVQEGFGLLPFEAAAFGVPCLFAAKSSLAELLDPQLATIVDWNPASSASRAAPLLREGAERTAHVAALRHAAQRLRWSDCARATAAVYRKALAAPSRESAEAAWQSLERENEIVGLDRSAAFNRAKLLELLDQIGPDGLALVGPDALLSRADQRSLLAVATRPSLRRLLFGGLRGAYRVTRAASRSSS